MIISLSVILDGISMVNSLGSDERALLTEGSVVGELEIAGRSYLVVNESPNTGPNRTRTILIPSHIKPCNIMQIDTQVCYVYRQDDLTSPASAELGLSPRELQIVSLVAIGHPNKMVADHLKISEWTVATYLRRIFCKLGVDSRAAMVFRCRRLLEPASSRSDR